MATTTSPQTYKRKLAELEIEVESLRKKEEATRKLYNQLLNSYNSNHTASHNKTDIKTLTELHIQEKNKLSRQFQELIRRKDLEFSSITQEMESLRESEHNYKIKYINLDTIYKTDKAQYEATIGSLQNEISELQRLNSTLAEGHKMTLHRQASNQDKEVTHVKEKLSSHYIDIINHKSREFDSYYSACDQTVHNLQQQLVINKQHAKALEASYNTAQETLETKTNRYEQQIRALKAEIGQLKEDLATATREAQTSNHLLDKQMELTRILENKIESKDAAISKLNIKIKKMSEAHSKQLAKEKALVAKFREGLNSNNKYLEIKLKTDKKQAQVYRAKEKQLLIDITNIKNKYEKEHTEIMSKLCQTHRGNRTRSNSVFSVSQYNSLTKYVSKDLEQTKDEHENSTTTAINSSKQTHNSGSRFVREASPISLRQVSEFQSQSPQFAVSIFQQTPIETANSSLRYTFCESRALGDMDTEQRRGGSRNTNNTKLMLETMQMHENRPVSPFEIETPCFQEKSSMLIKNNNNNNYHKKVLNICK